MPSSKLKEIFSISNPNENVTMTIENLSNYLNSIGTTADENDPQKHNTNVWILNKVLNI